MVIKHNFYIFFAVLYFALLAIGVPIGMVFGHLTGLNGGVVVNIVCFAAAVQLSVTRFGARWFYVEGPSSISMSAIIQKRRFFLPFVYAATGVVIDIFFYASASYYFRGGIVEFNYWRLLIMLAAYYGLTYFVITSLNDSRKNRG